MIQFLCHDAFLAESKKLNKRFRNLNQGLDKFKKLCEIQFHPSEPKAIIGPGKLHRIIDNEIWTIWKIELVVPNSNLRPSQFPRLWFAVKGSVIAFLCVAMHGDNYNTNELDRIATDRATEIF